MVSPEPLSADVSGEPELEPWHGTRSGYQDHGCHCALCRRGWADYYAERGYGPRYYAKKKAQREASEHRAEGGAE